MVYCGKPSGGCHACRQRKTRCDQRLQGCTQCERTKRACPGYRVLGDIIFRNESDNVIRKFKAKEARSKQATPTALIPAGIIPPSPTVSDMPDEYSSDVEIMARQFPISRYSLAPTLEDRAMAFFVTHYTVNISGPTKGHLDFVTAICGEDADEGLLSAMKAIGLAGLAHSAHAPAILKNAQYQYVKALHSTNEALKSTANAKKDSTLSAIMILCIYETVTGVNQKSLLAWAQHIKGAAALLKLRGLEQLRTPRGRRMFIQVASGLMIICIQRGVALPDYIVEWMDEAKRLLSAPEPAFVAQETMLKYTMFRAAVQNGTISQPHDILAGALKLDDIFVDLFVTNVPPEWQYQTVYTDVKSDVIWDGKYHIYFDYWVSQIWNAMRTIRILLNELIRKVYLRGFACRPPLFIGPEHSAQYQRSTDVLFELQADILATVPQHLGYVKPGYCPKSSGSTFMGAALTSRFPWDDFKEMHKVEEPVVRMTGPYFLLWPLWLAGVMDVATKEVEVFVVKNLKTIGTTLGIQQALVLAQAIEAKTGITVW